MRMKMKLTNPQEPIGTLMLIFIVFVYVFPVIVFLALLMRVIFR